MSFLCGLFILALGIVFQNLLMRVLGSTVSILPYARDYSFFILIAAPAMASSCVLNNILRYEGKAAFAMVGLTSGAILNILGDFLLIRILEMDIRGAGISTAVSQYISLGILMYPFLTRKVQSSISPRYFKMSFSVIGSIITVGMPSMVRQGLSSISVMALNLCAHAYGDAAIAAMSITSRIIMMMFCVSVGIGQGFQPVSAFNYGAKKYSRVREAFQCTCIINVCIMLVATVIGLTFAEPLIRLFRDDPEVIAIGTTALRLQSVTLPFMAVSLCGNMLFQSIGKGLEGTILASLRSGLCFIPIILVLSRYLGIFGIQLAQPLADVVSIAVTIPFVVRFFATLPADSK
jgi:putative MATE family efflux protein